MSKRLLVWSLIMLAAESQILSAYDFISRHTSRILTRIRTWIASLFLLMCLLPNIAKPYGSTKQGLWILLTYIAVAGGPWLLRTRPSPDVGDSAAIIGQ